MHYLREAFHQGMMMMRISIAGPRAGPVRTTLWSSRPHGGGGKVLAAIFLLPALALLALQFRYWPVDAAAAAIAGLMLLGRRAQRRNALSAASPPAARGNRG